MGSYSRPRVAPEEAGRLTLAACRAALAAGATSLSAETLRKYGARGDSGAIRDARDAAIARGDVARPVAVPRKRGHYKAAKAGASRPAGRDRGPCAAEIRDARKAMETLGLGHHFGRARVVGHVD